ncbi:plasmid pRiA4b ORF-3 family protein [Nocardioides marmoraquaticus]
MGDDAELLRRFHAATSGQELVGLRDLASMLLGPGEAAERPRLRRAPLRDVRLLTLRLELDHAEPPIWREVELRSDLVLADVHAVVMAAYGWADRHLHRFSLGGGPFDQGGELFLCPFDVDEGEDVGDGAWRVRLDEVVRDAGDVLRYVYDYGDMVELTLRVVAVRPAPDDARLVVATGGSRAAPPEDCGGLTDAVDLAGVLPDPARFDLVELEAALGSMYLDLRRRGVHPLLAELCQRLLRTESGDDLPLRLLGSSAPDPDDAALAAAYRPHRWLLDRAYGDGIPLTGAGYLRPADVEALADLVPGVRGYPGARTREVHLPPLLAFRESLQTLGLLRKRKGRLLLTRAGDVARRDPGALRAHLADRLRPDDSNRFALEASLLVLAYAATAPGGALPLARIARILGEFGWSNGGEPISRFALSHVVRDC